MEIETYMRFVLTLLFVLALIGVLAWLARRAGLGNRVARASGSRRRLSVSEVKVIDGKRRLVLVRRDEVEHLVLLGPQKDLVLEAGIPAAEPDDEDVKQGSFKQQVSAKMTKASRPRRKRAKPSASGAKA
ncbi:MAG: FliO/MopB family protein [Alphaproteobacteria bacterium]